MSEDSLRSAPRGGPESPLDRHLPWFLLFAGVVGTLPVLRSLRVADLNWCYPYLSGDSYDWINNGLWWAGVPVRPNFRPPGLPLVMAALEKLGVLNVLPLLNFLVLGATAVLLHRLLRERFRPSLAALSAWVFYANGYSQDIARWILAEVWAVFFVVLAALFFVRAARRPQLYVPFGVAVGVGFLFHYAALPAALGFAAAVLVGRREHLRTGRLWAGAAAASLLPALWLLYRWRHYLGEAWPARHGVEALVRFVPQNLRFYAYDGLALLGLLVVPLYVAGALRCLDRAGREERLLRRVFVPVLATLALFFGLFYDWTDKRFLLYLFPFALGFFALGVEGLVEWSRRTPALGAVAAVYLLGALAWNQITYPRYGIQHLALTPRDFLEAVLTQDDVKKSTLHLAGARVVRVHRSLPGAFAGGLFDVRLRPPVCAPDAPDYAAALELRRALDRVLPPGEPVSLEKLPYWPFDNWSGSLRLSNLLRRPVLWLDTLPCRIATTPLPDRREILASGPYRVACRP